MATDPRLHVSQNDKLITHRYDSLSDFAGYQADHPGYDMTKRSRQENLDFSGCASIAEAVSRAQRGLPETGLKVLRASRQLAATAMRTASRDDVLSQFDTAGAYVDMGRYVEGVPECMVDFTIEQRPVANPVVTIVSNVNASWTVDKDDLAERGRLVVALIKAIETAGRSTELWVDSTNVASGRGGGGDRHYRIAVNVKRASQPLDMGAVMYAFTDPSVLRCLMFNAMHALPKSQHGAYGVGHGYGRVVRESIRVDETYGPGAVYLPAVKHGDNAEQTVTRVLAELGIG